MIMIIKLATMSLILNVKIIEIAKITIEKNENVKMNLAMRAILMLFRSFLNFVKNANIIMKSLNAIIAINMITIEDAILKVNLLSRIRSKILKILRETIAAIRRSHRRLSI